MKFFEVTLTYTATTTILIEAKNINEAEDLAWEELATDGSYRSDYGDWNLESITEATKEGETA